MIELLTDQPIYYSFTHQVNKHDVPLAFYLSSHLHNDDSGVAKTTEEDGDSTKTDDSITTDGKDCSKDEGGIDVDEGEDKAAKDETVKVSMK